MPSNVAAIAASRLQKMAKEFERAQRVAVERGSFEAKTVLLNELDRVTSGRKLRNVGKSGAKLNVRYDVKGQRNPTGLLRAVGPWHLIENPIKPHDISPRKRRGKGKKAVVTPAGPRAKVRHPGVRNPKKPWSKGIEKAKPKVRREIDRAYTGAFKRGATR